jgi:hypothetical protein
MKFVATLLLTVCSFAAFSQGIDNYSKKFTKYDLVKWRTLMEFKPKYFDTKTFEDFVLKLEQFAFDQWHVELVVTYEDYKKGDDAMMFVFKKQLREYYGTIDEDKFNKWYIPYYVFLQLDKWAADYIQKQKGR